jgi:hypothetical protein
VETIGKVGVDQRCHPLGLKQAEIMVGAWDHLQPA